MRVKKFFYFGILWAGLELCSSSTFAMSGDICSESLLKMHLTQKMGLVVPANRASTRIKLEKLTDSKLKPYRKISEGWAQKNQITDSMLLFDIVSGFGRLDFKFSEVQELASLSDKNLSNEADQLNRSRRFQLPRRSYIHSAPYDYPTRDVLIALDYLFTKVGASKDLFFRGEIIAKDRPLPKVNEPFISKRFISTSSSSKAVGSKTFTQTIALTKPPNAPKTAIPE